MERGTLWGHMTNNVLHLRVAVRSHARNRLSLPRVPCGSGDENFPVPGFKRTQFPVRVCFGVTISKAQGQPFGGKLGLDLTDECFIHSQLYIGQSRVTVCVRRQEKKTRNVVYLEPPTRTLFAKARGVESGSHATGPPGSAATPMQRAISK